MQDLDQFHRTLDVWLAPYHELEQMVAFLYRAQRDNQEQEDECLKKKEFYSECPCIEKEGSPTMFFLSTPTLLSRSK